jgi:hypothetical protein
VAGEKILLVSAADGSHNSRVREIGHLDRRIETEYGIERAFDWCRTQRSESFPDGVSVQNTRQRHRVI